MAVQLDLEHALRSQFPLKGLTHRGFVENLHKRGRTSHGISTAFPFRLVASGTLCHIGALKAVSRNG
jgi:hypothetical protein